MFSSLSRVLVDNIELPSFDASTCSRITFDGVNVHNQYRSEELSATFSTILVDGCFCVCLLFFRENRTVPVSELYFFLCMRC